MKINEPDAALVAEFGGTEIKKTSDEAILYAGPMIGRGLRSPELIGFVKCYVGDLIALAYSACRPFPFCVAADRVMLL